MAADSNPEPEGLRTEELTAVIQEIRDRVRARLPEGTASAGVVLPDLLPILHERDAAEAKVAAIGTVNPRPPGVWNSIVQWAKKLIARLLDWHVRDQADFNRAIVRSLGATLEALNENNCALSALGARDEALGERADALRKALDENREALEALDAGQEALVSRLEALGTSLEALGARLEAQGVRLEARLEALSASAETGATALGARLDARIDDLSTGLETRTAALGTRLDARIEDLSASLETRSDALGGRLDALGARSDARIEDLSASVETRSDALGGRLDALGARVDARIEDLSASAQARATALDARLDGVGGRLDELLELRDIRSHWAQWRVEWERKLDQIERHFFRNVAELHGGFQHRATTLESGLRETINLQHSDFLAALWRGIRETRTELERLIHAELRLIRQRAALPQIASPAAVFSPAPAAAPPIDWLHFASRFRGSEEYVRERQRFYLPHFEGCRQVLDLGCGRGEFLELLEEEEIPARGIDLSTESVALCRAKGLDAEVADLFSYLDALPDGALDGIFCAQVIEHLPPARLPEMLRLSAAKLAPGGVLAVETPNPECLAILTSHFYLDPTHHHPVPPLLLAFYLEECGMGGLQTHRFAPAAETMPALNSLPAEFREAFFGSLDYAVLGRKL
ncbi:MAG: methyltransferase domain-containing protein [Bryobacteraceae bacterium]